MSATNENVSSTSNYLRSNNPGTADGRTAYVAPFWPNSTDLKSFFLEYYAKIVDDGWGNGPCYFLSSGFGGAHAILFGMQKDPTSGLYHPTGNIRRYNTGSTVYDANNINSDSAFGTVAGEWAHWSCAFDASTCLTYCYLNGICTGVISFGTPGTHVRQIQPSDSTQDIYIAGGSNHSMLSMGFAQMRLCDGHAAGGQLYQVGTPEVPFTPDRIMGPMVGGASFAGSPADLLIDATVGAGLVLPDLSRAGRQGDGVRRAALITNTISQGFGGTPVWDYDPLMPCRTDAGTGPFGERARTPTTPPVGAVVYDSFERANATYLNGTSSTTNPQLGSVEVGVNGSKTWSYGLFPGQSNGNPLVWGILCGYAVPLVTNQKSWAAVETGIANMQVSVDAYNNATYTRKRTGLVARFSDTNNFWFLCQANSDASQLFLVKVVAGVETTVSTINASPATTWTTLTLNMNGNTITVKTDANTVYTGSDSFNASATKAGLAKYDYPAPTVSSTFRAKNFTVKAAF
jgi:hypothetical protein